MIRLILIVVLSISPSILTAYESENKVEINIIAKASKFIKWKKKPYAEFIITILNNPYGELFDEILANKTINRKKVKLIYIDDINKLQDTHILYVAKSDAKDLENVLAAVANKNILTVSGIRGFAEKDGLMQIYFVLQKVKLKINLDTAKKEKLKISSSLLRISDIVRN